MRDHVDVVAVPDQRAWAALLALVDECPVLPRAVDERAGGSRSLRVPAEVAFISENAQIARVLEFARSLPHRLV